MSVPATHLQSIQRSIHDAPPPAVARGSAQGVARGAAQGVSHGPGPVGTPAWNGFADDLWNFLLSLGGSANSTEDRVGTGSGTVTQGPDDASDADGPGQSEPAPAPRCGFKGTFDSTTPVVNLAPGKPDSSSKQLPLPRIADPFGTLAALPAIAPLSGLKRAGFELTGPDPGERRLSVSGHGQAPPGGRAGGDRPTANGDSVSVTNTQDWQLAADLAFAARLDVLPGAADNGAGTASGHPHSNTGAPASPGLTPMVSQPGPADGGLTANGSIANRNSSDTPAQDGPDPPQNGAPGRAAPSGESQPQNGDAQQPGSEDRPPDNGSSPTANGDSGWRVAFSEPSRAQNENNPHSTSGGEPAKPASAAPEPAPGQGPALQQKAREIGLRLETGTDSSVAVRLVERSGELHVAVRTHDEDLARSLQNNLSDLVGSLKREGISADTWTPPASEAPHADTGNPGSRSGGDTFGSGSGSQQRGQSGRRGNQERERRPAWVDGLDEAFPASLTS